MQDVIIDYSALKEKLKDVIDQLPDSDATQANALNIDSRIAGPLTKMIKSMKSAITTLPIKVSVSLERQNVSMIAAGDTVKLSPKDQVNLYQKFDYKPKFGDEVHIALAKAKRFNFGRLCSRRQWARLLALGFVRLDNQNLNVVLTEAGQDMLEQLRVGMPPTDIKILRLLLSTRACATAHNGVVLPHFLNIVHIDYFLWYEVLFWKGTVRDLTIANKAFIVLKENYKKLLGHNYPQDETIELCKFMSLEELPRYLSSTNAQIRTAATKRFEELNKI